MLARWFAPPAACFRCGHDPARPLPSCDHALTHSGRLRWHPAPWLADTLETTVQIAFSLGMVAVLCGLGPLLWWFIYDWPPEGWPSLFGVLAVALVTLSGAFVSVGILASLSGIDPGRRWDVVDTRAHDDDRVVGSVWLRRGRLHRGGVARHTLSPCPWPPSPTSARVAATTDDPVTIITAAVLHLAHRGPILITRIHTDGWSVDPASGVAEIRAHNLTLAAPTDPIIKELPWLEQFILDATPTQPTSLRRAAAEFTRSLAHELGYTRPDDSAPSLKWTSPISPGATLQARIRETAPSASDPGDEVPAPDSEETRTIRDILADVITAEFTPPRPSPPPRPAHHS